MPDETRNVLKLSLNYPALVRLIGGDTEIETELRLQVAQQFTKKHLAPLMHTPEVQATLTQIENAALQMIVNQIGVFKKGGFLEKTTLSLSPELMGAIQNKAKELLVEVTKSIHTTMHNYYTDQVKYYTEHADFMIKRELAAGIEKKIQEGIEARLKLAAGVS